MDLLIIWMVFLFYCLLKIFNTGNQRKLIIDSIGTYVDFNDDIYGCRVGINMLDSIEPFEKTLFRLFDWGYERILPDEYYQILRPYIIITKGRKINE